MTKFLRPNVALTLFLIAATCAFAATPIVTVTTPTNSETEGSPVHFIASASSPDCADGISAMRIYSAPGVSAYTRYSSQINSYISLANGTYNAVVQAWDHCGGVGKTTVKIKVDAQAAPAGFLYTANSAYWNSSNHGPNYMIGYEIVSGGNGALAMTRQAPVNTDLYPIDVASDKGGHRLYVGNYFASDVSAYFINRQNGYLTSVSGSPFAANQYVGAVAVHPSGHYVFATRDQHEGNDGVAVFHVQSNGSLVEIPGSPFPTQNDPSQIVVDPSGKYLYVVDSEAYLDAFQISSDGSLTPLPGEPYQLTTRNGCTPNPLGLIDLFGKALYTANGGDYSISGFKVNAITGTLTQIAGSPWADPQECPPGGVVCPGGCSASPVSLAIDGSGNFLYAEDGATDGVTIFRINSSGALTYVKDEVLDSTLVCGEIRTDSGGNYLYAACGPDPDYEVNVNPGLDEICIYVINHTTGDLTASPSSPEPVPETGGAVLTSFAVTP
ncbi:MAG TPA: beta-propeller fold lactonase family protein [Terriglobales bacterium]|nr:beta-propeller fold lactonase family protein [Terriglobales bacterium]